MQRLSLPVVDGEQSKKIHFPPRLPGITRVTTVKILGVTFTNSLSVAEHVHNVISSCGRVTSKHCNGKTVN